MGNMRLNVNIRLHNKVVMKEVILFIQFRSSLQNNEMTT